MQGGGACELSLIVPACDLPDSLSSDYDPGADTWRAIQLGEGEAGFESVGVIVLNPPKAIECAVDKYLATTRLMAAGLPVPEPGVCASAESALEAFETLGGDVVVKPIVDDTASAADDAQRAGGQGQDLRDAQWQTAVRDNVAAERRRHLPPVERGAGRGGEADAQQPADGGQAMRHGRRPDREDQAVVAPTKAAPRGDRALQALRPRGARARADAALADDGDVCKLPTAGQG